MTDRLQDHDIETAALRSVLLDGNRWLIGCELSDEDFTEHRNRAVWKAMCKVSAEEEPIDNVNVRTQLVQEDRMLMVGEEYFLGLTDSVDRCTDKQLARLKDLTRLRGLRPLAMDVLRQCELAELDPLLESISTLSAQACAASPRKTSFTAKELARRVLEHTAAPEVDVKYIYPGTEMLEKAYGALPEGSMSVFAADTGVGKTSLALLAMMGLAKRGVACGMISIEDGPDVVGSRLMSHVSGQSSRDIMMRRLNEIEKASVYRHGSDLDELPIFVDFIIAGTDSEVAMSMARMKANGCRYVVVDYIQEIQCSVRRQDRRNEIAFIMRRMKSTAERLGLALVIISQLSRPKTDRREPTKHDLKEAGELENAADTITVMWRDTEDDDAPIHVKVAKCKWGGGGRRWTMRRKAPSGVLVESIDDDF